MTTTGIDLAVETQSPFVIEECGYLIGRVGNKFAVGNFGDLKNGNASSVSFADDWTFIENLSDQNRLAGLWHTHPPGCPDISARDIDTMQQWSTYLGKPLLCVIACEGVLRIWRFNKQRFKELKNFEILNQTLVARV